MSLLASEIITSYFADGAGPLPRADLRIDVLDGWTVKAISTVAPTTISWCAPPAAVDAPAEP